MGKKKKLSPDQSNLLDNLKWYSEKCITFDCKDKDQMFVEMIEEGAKFAYFSARGDALKENYFTSVMGLNTLEDVWVYLRYNLDSAARVVDLFTLQTEVEYRRAYQPHFNVLVQKMDDALWNKK